MTRHGLLGVVIAFAVYGCAGSGLAVASREASPPPTSTTFAAGFTPNKLGAYSTMEVAFHLYRPAGATPPPLTGIEFLLPTGVSLTTSELGLDVCEQDTLENAGSQGCLPDSVMGYGSATMIAPTAVEGILEPAGVTILEAPAVDHHTTLFFNVNGSAPVIAQVVFSGQMLDATEPFGGNLNTTLPITPGLPGENDVSLVSMKAGIGSKGLTYYKDVHGRREPYTPEGVVIPSRCPRGGFPFEAKFRFADGSSESASTTSPCPRGARAQRQGQR